MPAADSAGVAGAVTLACRAMSTAETTINETQRDTPDQPTGTLAVLRRDLPVALLGMALLVVPLLRLGALEDSFLGPKTFLVLVLATLAAVALLIAESRAGTAFGRGRSRFGWSVPAAIVQFGLIIWLWLHFMTTGSARSVPMAYFDVKQHGTFVMAFAGFGVAIAASGVAAGRALASSGLAAAAATAAWTIAEDATRPGTAWAVTAPDVVEALRGAMAAFGLSGLVPRLPDWRGYLGAGLANSGHIAGFIGLFLPFAIVRFLSARQFPGALFAVILLLFAALAVTWSVGSTGATLVSLAVWGGLAAFVPSWGLRAGLHWRRAGWLVAGGAAVAAFYLLPHPANPHRLGLWAEAFGSDRWREGAPTRLVIYETTWHMIQEHWLLGVGAGNFTLEYVRRIVPGLARDPELLRYAGAYTNAAHNDYLQMWAEAGIAAPLAWLGVLGGGIAAAVGGAKRAGAGLDSDGEDGDESTPPRPPDIERAGLMVAASAGITVFALDSLMSFPVRLPAHMLGLMFWLAAAAALSGPRKPVAPALAVRPSAWRMLIPLVPMIAVSIIIGNTQFRRLAASFHLKQGRAVVESAPVLADGRPEGLWSVAQGQISRATLALADGDATAAHTLASKAAPLMDHPAAVAARARFEAALALDPDYSDASSRLGAWLLAAGKPGQARAETDRTLRNLEGGEVWERLGMACWLSGDPAGARRAWTVCRDRLPQQADYYNALLRNADR